MAVKNWQDAQAEQSDKNVENITMRRCIPARFHPASLALVLALATTACQRPTELLPAAPQFEMQAPPSTPVVSEVPSDVMDVVDANGVVPGSVEDFLRYVGTDKVYFEYDSAELTAEGRTTLDREAEWFAKYPTVRMSLEGHADERGTREYNFALGERRAAAMKFYLNVRGITNERMTSTSFGKERPAVADSDENGWKLNRRGETVLIGAVGQN